MTPLTDPRRSPMRRIAVALSTAALAALLALTTVPASADPALSIDNVNGRRLNVRVENPDNPNCYVTVTVDIHFGFAATGDSGPEYVSPVSWVSDGPCAKRWQVDNLRTRLSGFDQTGVVNDFFPAKQSNPRNNTPALCWEPDDAAVREATGGIVVDNGATVSLFDERAPQDGVCEDDTQKVKNPLHNVFDYEPDTSVVRAYGDWIALTGDTNGLVAQQRTFITIQWDAAPGVPNWSITRHNVLGGQAFPGA